VAGAGGRTPLRPNAKIPAAARAIAAHTAKTAPATPDRRVLTFGASGGE
jgi:hypothetical protein